MHFIFLLSSIILYSSAWAIKGGVDGAVLDSPWYAKLSFAFGHRGGAIVSPNSLLTAAHCMTSAGHLVSVGIGGTGNSYGFVPTGAAKKIVVHPRWDPGSNVNLYDLALIFLDDNITSTSKKLTGGRSSNI